MKNVVITGATNGIGLSVVRQLINKNYQIYIIGKNKQKGNKIINELKKTNLNYKKSDLSEFFHPLKIFWKSFSESIDVTLCDP